MKPWQKQRAAELLHKNLSGHIALRELAAACSLSVRQFSRSFRHTFGASAHQYLIRLRVARAKTLLAQTDHPLAQIAHSCGFCDQAAFTRAFKKAERITPSQWRKLRQLRV